LKKVFSPEFRNRLDSIIQFKPLSMEVITHVVDKFVIELEGQLEERNVTISLDDEAKLWLAENGYDEKMGARPMARLIQDKIKKALAEELLFGGLQKGGAVFVTVTKGELTFSFESLAVH